MNRLSLLALLFSSLLGPQPLSSATPPDPRVDGDYLIVRRMVPVVRSDEQAQQLRRRHEYYTTLRQLGAELEFGQAVLEAQRERTDVYHRVFSQTPALLLTRQESRLAELDSELYLRELEQQRLWLLHQHPGPRVKQVIIHD